MTCFRVVHRGGIGRFVMRQSLSNFEKKLTINMSSKTVEEIQMLMYAFLQMFRFHKNDDSDNSVNTKVICCTFTLIWWKLWYKSGNRTHCVVFAGTTLQEIFISTIAYILNFYFSSSSVLRCISVSNRSAVSLTSVLSHLFKCKSADQSCLLNMYLNSFSLNICMNEVVINIYSVIMLWNSVWCGLFVTL